MTTQLRNRMTRLVIRQSTTLLLLMVLISSVCCALRSGAAESSSMTATPLRVMSFNIRHGKAKDGENHWDHRHDLVVKTIHDFQPDLLGTQEVLDFQATFLRQQLPEYEFVGVGRNDGKLKGEMTAIFYRRDRFKKITEGHFWMSETPEVPGSKSWDTSLSRMTSWVELQDVQSEKHLFLFNTHFDHRGQQARLESAKLLRQMAIDLSKDTPFIIIGDFNAPAHMDLGKTHETLLHGDRSDGITLLDTFQVLHPEEVRGVTTFGGFKDRIHGPRIDWIIVSEGFKIQASSIVRTSYNGSFPSDHYPVTAILESPGNN
ncbi:MAG: endonuclease/exonuclease/phosphatase family protein [Planctomycetota bacterium]|nr:endonuclease/exonuclease/phosphatase family protein [Planctomycetota bacterium]